MGMVAPAAFRGEGGERGGSLGGESVCEGDKRRGPGRRCVYGLGCYVSSRLALIFGDRR